MSKISIDLSWRIGEGQMTPGNYSNEHEVIFSPKVSTRAEKIKFHPSQHLVWLKDNNLKM